MDTSTSVLQELKISKFADRGMRVLVKRDDLIHPEVSGNKWRKLKYNMEQFRSLRKEHLLTFGGAYSNHLLATASACHSQGISSIGLVRGEELSIRSNPLLMRCSELGMQLVFISREEYALRGMKEYHEELVLRYPNSFIVPEGGANYYGMIGCQEILSEVQEAYDHVFVAQGTTTTSCGLLLSLNDAHLHVVPVLKGFDALREMRILLDRTGIDSDVIEELLAKVTVHSEGHFGGYAKVTDELLSFIESVKSELGLPLDMVYTGKTFYRMLQELEHPDYDNKTILFIHTGGLYLNDPLG